MAETPEERQRRRRRKRLVRGLLVGGAALGVPALVNAVVARRAKRLPAAAWGEIRTYRSSAGRISFRAVGDGGPPLLLLHSIGPGHSGLEWQRLTELLRDRFQLFVPDLLGFGNSGRPRITYDSHLYLDLVEDLLQDVVGERATIVAAGLSAAYAVQVAVDHPELVEALALITPLGVDLHGEEPDLKDSAIHRLLRLPVIGTSALNVFTSRAAIGHHLRREVYGDDEVVEPGRVEEHYRSSHLPGSQAAIAAHVSGYLNHSVSKILSRVEPPVWIGWGRAATSPAVESADLWLRDLPTAELEVFEEASLLPHLEQPERVAAAIDDFLARRRR